MNNVTFKYSLNIALNVRQSEKAINFYKNTLGLGLVSLQGEGDCGIEMSAGPLSLWLDHCTKDEEEHVGKVFFEFETNNLDAAKVKLEQDGV
jgi:catechol 2,3-dioxygenase-like lactoylglutathione lyase family enzyme